MAAFCTRSLAVDAAVIITELQYNPAAGDTEWVELHSLSGVDIDISGWRLTSGIEYTFGDNAKIPGHGYIVVAADPNAPSLGGVGALGPWSGSLSNGGERVRLVNRDGREMDIVEYNDSGDWPAGADGSGATLSRRDPENAASGPGNWLASADMGGTPGRANFSLPGQPPTVTSLAQLDSPWKYFIGTPGAGWELSNFDDTSWTSAPSAFYSGSPTLAGGSDGLLGYWPLNETSGTSAANLGSSGTAATLVNSPSWINDPTRGRCISFSGASQFVNAGSATIPQMTLTNDFTWSFWASSTQAAGSNVILGNRYSPSPGVEWNPREFIKFTPVQFEFHRNGVGENIDYADIGQNSGWMHHAVVKSGNLLTYYRNGIAGGTRTITQGLNNPQPFYFGGEQNGEYWAGLLDDVAVWTKALTTTQVSSLTTGAATPLNVAAPAALNTQLGASSTYAFRRTFAYTGIPSRTTLTLKVLVEDGCTVWLNGTQVYSQNNPPIAGTSEASLSADIPIPNSALLRGTNVLAVQTSTFASDPDMVFAAQLTASEQAPTPADASPGVVFSEISPAGLGFQLELTNISGGAIDLAGYVLRSSSGGSALLSGMINAGSFVVFNSAQLGFTPAAGDKLFLFAPGGAALIDSREVTNRLRARSPSFPGRWLFPNAATFGTANTFTFNSDVVINEIMYDQRPLTQSPFAEDPEQWVEVYNRGASSVDLSGWSFSDGIDFIFPVGTSLPAGEYLVVSNNQTALKAKWPAAASKVVGNFSGNIRRGGERLRLEDAFGNPANEVTFGSDAPWPIDAHGGGSSLELRDARADGNSAQAWAASNEAHRGSWQTYTFEAPATPSVSNDPTVWNEFIFGLLDRGSMMIDDISVIEAPTGVNRQLITNGAFDTSTTGWRFLGTHSRASVITDPFGTGQVLRVDATGPTEHMHNHAETMLKFSGSEVTINSGLTYRISFRARWISGSNLLNSRLYFNRIAKTTPLPVAAGGGTPGVANSTVVPNLGPTFSGLTHSPAIPPGGQPVTVSVNVTDPDGLGAINLLYAVNGVAFQTAAMTNQGSGRYTGTIPAQGGGAKVQFYVQATDTVGAIGTAPALGTNSRAVVQWEDGQARLTLNNVKPNNIRIVMIPADITKLHTATNVMSNDRIPCTVIWNERDVYYDCGVHLHGSERGRNEPLRVSFNVRFPADRLLLGAHDSVVIDRSGAGDQFSQREILIKRAITRAGGIPGSEDDICRVIAPQGAHTGPAILGRQRIVSGEYLESAYPEGDDGDLFKYELIYHPLTTTGVTGNRGNPENLKFPEPDNVAGVGVNSLGSDKEAYRWHWLIASREEADDYSRLITLLTALGRPADAQFFNETNALMDVSEWLRSFAVEILFGINDNYATGAQHNLYIYRRPSDGKWLMFPYDMDFMFQLSETSSLFPNNELSKLTTNNAANRRTYWSHIYELCQTSFNATYLTPWAIHYTAFVNENLTQHMTYVNNRRSFALSQLNSAIPQVPFNISTPDGSSPGPTMTIAGTAWVDVKEMRLAGSTQPLSITWTGTQTWQTTVTIAPGPNAITINAFNALGAQVGTDTVNITGTGTLVPATAANLVISEIMYHPGDPNTTEVNAGFTDPEAFEYLELMNISPTDFITLSGVRFNMGVSFTFTNVTMAPGARALLVGNLSAFLQRYGNGLTILGQYQPAKFLANGGDRIELWDAQGQDIRDFSYDDSAPWPEPADGSGFSLVLINPTANPDHSKPENWRLSAAVNGNPGGSDATTFAGNPVGDDNGDGIINLTQYALAGMTPFEHPFLGEVTGFLTLSFRRNLAADDVHYSVERSIDLATWTSGADVEYVGETHLLDGTSEVTWRSTHPLGETPREFLRLKLARP
jgi:hypothetical protein